MLTNATPTCLCWASHLIHPFTCVHCLNILILQGRKPRLRVQFVSSLPWRLRSQLRAGLHPSQDGKLTT